MLRGVLGVGERFYTAAVRRRNRRYDDGRAIVHRVGVPVISVGNLTLGGVGKTPLVAWLARRFSNQGVRVAVVSRGYGAKPGTPNDEALELRRLLPNVPHLQDADRVAAACRAVAEFGARVIVLDDGFQHRRLGRDLDIVVLDALQPFGFGRVFPRGLLREPFEGLRRADAIILSRADLVAKDARQAIWKTVRLHAPQTITAETVARAAQARLGRRRRLFAGHHARTACSRLLRLGNPAGFRGTLDACGCRVVGFREFPDHHRYRPADLDALSAWADKLGASAVLCTGKDLAKLSVEWLGRVPLWALAVEVEFLAGQESLESQLNRDWSVSKGGTPFVLQGMPPDRPVT